MSPAGEPFPTRAVLLLGFTQTATWATLYYAITILAARIGAETGWPVLVVQGGFSLALLASGLVAPAVGRAVDRRGGVVVMVYGHVAAGLGLAAVAMAPTPALYLAGWVLAGAAMAATLYDPAFAALAQLAPSRTRAAITALTLFGGFASTIGWPLTFFLLGHTDWRGIYLVYAAFQILVAAPVCAFAVPRPPMERLAHGQAAGAPAARIPPHLVVPFWLIAGALAANAFIFSALSVHFVPALTALGTMREQDAVAAGMLVGPAQVLARLLEFVLFRRLSPVAVGVLSLALLPAGLAVVIGFAFAPAAALVFAVLYGASNGLITIARGILPIALFGRANYGAMLGRLAAPQLVLRAIAPAAFAGLLASVGLTQSFLLCFVLSLASLAAILVLQRRMAGGAAGGE